MCAVVKNVKNSIFDVGDKKVTTTLTIATTTTTEEIKGARFIPGQKE